MEKQYCLCVISSGRMYLCIIQAECICVLF